MGILRKSMATLLMLSSVAFATESGDLLDAFNEISLEVPTIAFEEWGGSGSIESPEFKAFYVNQFNQYVDLASKLSIRAVACSSGDIPQASDYQAMTDLKALYAGIAETLTRSQTQLKLWVDLKDQGAMAELGKLIPKLTVSYSRMLFELSSCSGYLYGELVN
ncbi:MAG: hypothetical protein R3309_10940 [Reinekea sp.]|nr:hypothetical protein [Reinekea sp.]MDX1474676.1 hypothetical protein [Reinekea sp.]